MPTTAGARFARLNLAPPQSLLPAVAGLKSLPVALGSRLRDFCSATFPIGEWVVYFCAPPSRVRTSVDRRTSAEEVVGEDPRFSPELQVSFFLAFL